MRILAFLGGSLSELGKGTALSAIGALLQSCGFSVTVGKIDPYLNADAGNLSPEEHGEVFVLGDGSQVDLDFGSYERELGLRLGAVHSITSGGVFGKVLQDERDGAHLGQTVRLAVHVMDEVLRRIKAVALTPVGGVQADVCLLEVGGTVSDWDAEIYLEALRKLSRDAEAKLVVCLLVPLVIWSSEPKTKLAQDSVRVLRSRGLPPDFLVCRAESPLTSGTRSKLSRLCEVPAEAVWESPQTADLRQLPDRLREQGVAKLLCRHLDLRPPSEVGLCPLRGPGDRSGRVRVGLVGKYSHKNAYISVHLALEHAARQVGVDVEVELCKVGGCPDTAPEDATSDVDPALRDAGTFLRSFDAICVPGGFGARGFDEKVRVARWCLVSSVPFLGLCLGFHAGVVAICRQVLGRPSATSEEFLPDATAEAAVVVKRQGFSMRKGAHTVNFPADGRLRALYGTESASERFRHRFEVRRDAAPDLSRAGLLIARGSEGEVDALELAAPGKFFLGTQYHPEFESSERRAAPVFVGLVRAAVERQAARARIKLGELD